MDKLPFNWFDLVVIVMLVVGALRGRRRGMSQELLPLIKWIIVLVGCAFAYPPVADFIASTWFSRLFSSYCAYLVLAALIAGICSMVARSLGGKIIGSDVFGQGEYYLGIGAGAVRFFCILVFGLALLNARLFTAQEIEERRQFVMKNYDNDFFPALYQIQDAAFKQSLSGPYLHRGLEFLLIKPVVADNKAIQRRELDIP